jgi:hypothetical protein
MLCGFRWKRSYRDAHFELDFELDLMTESNIGPSWTLMICSPTVRESLFSTSLQLDDLKDLIAFLSEKTGWRVREET